jgi:hypothetical protein
LAAADLLSGMLMHGLAVRLSKHHVSGAESSRIESGSDQLTELTDNIQLANPDGRFDCERPPALAAARRFFL